MMTKKFIGTKPMQNNISMRNFTKIRWIDCLRRRDWSGVMNLQNVNEKTVEFTKQVNAALDECAPYRNFKVRDNFKPGLSEAAKKLIQKRDETRKGISSARFIHSFIHSFIHMKSQDHLAKGLHKYTFGPRSIY